MTTPYTLNRLTEDLTALGVRQGGVLMLHSSFKALGDVMGGPNTALQAVLSAVGEAGTVMMYVGWNDMPDFEDIPTHLHDLYRAEMPPFDPRTARAVRDHGIMAECLRTWPGAHRSLNPEASISAVGPLAEPLTRDHPLEYGYGVGSPLERLVQHGGQVLMLGAPLSTITLLHHAEAVAKLRHKHRVIHRFPMMRDGQRVWMEVEDYDTSEPHAAYGFRQIAEAALAAGGIGQRGQVGDAPCALFDAAALVRFATGWLEERFG
jgi:aminoglycoside 3-N-acetyltransferase